MTMKTPANHLLVIFGASGDLAWRKLIPSLYDLHRQHLLPERFAVLGVGRTELPDSDFRAKMEEGLRAFASTVDNGSIPSFLDKLYYCSVNTSSAEGYA